MPKADPKQSPRAKEKAKKYSGYMKPTKNAKIKIGEDHQCPIPDLCYDARVRYGYVDETAALQHERQIKKELKIESPKPPSSSRPSSVAASKRLRTK